MAKLGEIQYVANMVRVLGVSREEVENSLLGKPYTAGAQRGSYLIDLGQIFRLLPEPPARLLDLGCGSGWTSKMFALAGYDVVGLDISADMIELAKRNCSGLNAAQFFVSDYEHEIDYGSFQCAVIYDALHHAVDEACLINNVFNCLEPGGLFVTAEPGLGHSEQEGTKREAERWGTTEKDMPFSYQARLMSSAGFRDIRQYVRLRELPMVPVNTSDNNQAQQFGAVIGHTRDLGFTSICVAVR